VSTPVWRHILRGCKSMLVSPPIGTGGTVSAQYCYSVYLRHLVMASKHGLATAPRTVVELGPGDSIGIGLMAVLTGVEEYYALDTVRHASSETNLLVFDELINLLSAQVPIPCDGQFSEILPELDDYGFPSDILTGTRLTQTLAPERLKRLRSLLTESLPRRTICYLVPIARIREISGNSVDLIISQAVLEHVDHLEEIYAECFRILRPGGFMSHQIDLRCHDTASEWNGHWKYSELTWRLMRGGRPWFINRQPCSAHISMAKQVGFTICAEIKQSSSPGILREQLAGRFKALSDRDLLTAGIFLLASKAHE